ncbi:MAG: dienelactone hydrolase family protein [Bacteroidia bacterium]|nr:dienelactone hydrolase family protein [Bacteroidia bacterium]
MKKLLPLLLLFICPCLIQTAKSQTTVTFNAKDGVTITADWYEVSDTLPWIILFHQAGYSRGEYKDVIKRFHKLGYNCLAVDLRSGKEVNGVVNQTALDAQKKGKDTEYLDAEQDIIAAIDYLYTKVNEPVVILGSSYSASLCLKVAIGNPGVERVVAYSPGEYFGKKLKLKDAIKKLDKPVYVGCSAEEKPACEDLMKDVMTGDKIVFAPGSGGKHGSSALWKSNPNYYDYWISLMMFLDRG